MTTLAQAIVLYAGGPGSGCRGNNCGRPISKKNYQQMRQHLRGLGIKLKKNLSPWDVVRAYDTWFRVKNIRDKEQKRAQRVVDRAKIRLQRAQDKGKLPPRYDKKDVQERIDVKPVWKGRVKQSYQAQGYQITELKTPKQYEKNKGTWVNKPSSYKGQFLVDLAEQRTHNNPKERNSFFIHQAAPDKGVSVEVHRNLGQLSVNVIERRLGQYGAIEDHREVSFKNVGRAMGFLNKRYGITFKIK